MRSSSFGRAFAGVRLSRFTSDVSQGSLRLSSVSAVSLSTLSASRLAVAFPSSRFAWKVSWRVPLGAAAVASVLVAAFANREKVDEEGVSKSGFARLCPCGDVGSFLTRSPATCSSPKSDGFDAVIGLGGWEAFVRFARSLCALTASTVDYKISLRRADALRRHEQNLERAMIAAQEASRMLEGEADESRSVKVQQYSAEALRLESELRASREKREALLQQLHGRCARRMLAVCIRHGGLYTKVGQYVATLNHVLPSAYVTTLSQLLDDAARVPWNEAKQLLEEELGGPLESFFEEFDKEAVAAASLAQVHRARRKTDGVEVAVKLQRPRLRKHVGSDLAALRFLMILTTKVFPDFEFQWLLPEFEANMRQELNFMQEGFNAMRLRRLLANTPQVYVPWVDWQLTTPRVLTMEFVRGVKLSDSEAMLKNGLEREAVSRLVMRVFADMICVHGLVHCDPHPGNLLVRRVPTSCSSSSSQCPCKEKERHSSSESRTGEKCNCNGGKDEGSVQLVVLDHGMYRRLDPEFRLAYCRLWRALLLNRVTEGRSALQDLTTLSSESQSSSFSDGESAEPLSADVALDLLSVVLTYRPQIGLRSKLGKPMHAEDKARVLDQLRRLNVGGVNEFLRRLPRDLLWVLRMTNIVRSLNLQLGGDTRERLVAMGEAACRGAQLGNDGLIPKLEECAVFLANRKTHAAANSKALDLLQAAKTSLLECLYTATARSWKQSAEPPARGAPRWFEIPGVSSLNLPIASEFPTYHFRFLARKSGSPPQSLLFSGAKAPSLLQKQQRNRLEEPPLLASDPLESLYTQMVILNGRGESEPLAAYRGLEGKGPGRREKKSLEALRGREKQEVQGLEREARCFRKRKGVVLSSLSPEDRRSGVCCRPSLSVGSGDSEDFEDFEEERDICKSKEALAPWERPSVSEALLLRSLQVELWLTLAVLKTKLWLFDILLSVASAWSPFADSLPNAAERAKAFNSLG